MSSDIFFTSVTPSNSEGNTGDETTYSYTLVRDGDQPVTVNWEVRGIGDSPVNGDEFVGDALPSGQVTRRFGHVLGCWQ